MNETENVTATPGLRPRLAARVEAGTARTHEVRVGSVGIGGTNPLRIQSMTTSDTQDIDATVRQAIALAEVGCEIVRITAPNPAAAKCLGPIRKKLSEAGFPDIPLVADIHFLPSAAMEAIEHVEKVRVNPGNYADKKKFAVKEYSDADYERELQRLHEAFSPLVLRARTLGRALRIGTNHGSLSDRIMNRYGDTPLGMVESALEFLRIAESHGFKQIVLSMKASSPKVMIQAYRLLVARMAQEDMYYPLHLGVTEAGDGEDGRIKSAIGIGTLLAEGLGDTLRVSLTEDSVYEIPVARALADKGAQTRLLSGPPDSVRSTALAAKASALGATEPPSFSNLEEAPSRRDTAEFELAGGVKIGAGQVPAVIVRAASLTALGKVRAAFAAEPAHRLADTPLEGLLIPIERASEVSEVANASARGEVPSRFVVLELAPDIPTAVLAEALLAAPLPRGNVLLREFTADEGEALNALAQIARQHGLALAVALRPENVAPLADTFRELSETLPLIFTLADPHAKAGDSGPALTAYRQLAKALDRADSPKRGEGLRPEDRLLSQKKPSERLWIRNTEQSAVAPKPDFLSRLLDAATLSGALLCDGIGDMVSIETEPDPIRALKLTYNVLQGAGARTTKTEFVACPSCGRTLFDLQTTTQRIRAKTGHLKGVKIAIMGCIVNGPGEMADADFGYVGGAPGKINLYVGKQCIRYNIPQAEADDRLIDLIKEHGKWTEPSAAELPQ
nr:(E)-4-hydroxy-3-methylbut-2-enyl-diphosphate synthase [Cephaloticoccus capnophilus]